MDKIMQCAWMKELAETLGFAIEFTTWNYLAKPGSLEALKYSPSLGTI